MRKPLPARVNATATAHVVWSKSEKTWSGNALSGFRGAPFANWTGTTADMDSTRKHRIPGSPKY